MAPSHYKRGLCNEWDDNGTCKNGKFCMFAHGQDDQRSGDKNSWCPDLKRLGSCGHQETCKYFHSREELAQKFSGYKRDLCPQFKTTGTCKNGEFCLFAHGENDRLCGDVNRGTVRSVQSSTQNYTTHLKLLMKGKWCPRLIQKGSCNKMESCDYSHSQDELRTTRFYKKILCYHFEKTGSCETGEFCLHAHGHHELRTSQPANCSQSEGGEPCLGAPGESDLKSNITSLSFLKYKWCPNVVQEGSCDQLDSCNYAHSHDELKATPFYKLKLCAVYEEKGTCSKGKFCLYAHGRHELKGGQAELCYGFIRDGTCKYGEFCKFAHGENDKSGDKIPVKPASSALKYKWCPDVVQKGSCGQMESCAFAHSEDELKATPFYKSFVLSI